MSLSDNLSPEDISFVSNLVIEAGNRAPGLRANIKITEKSEPNDRVTTADFELSNLIVHQLRSRFRQDMIISEEDINPDTSNLLGRVWLIDPIDGTDNYISNEGEYSVMVGFLLDLKPLFGWVFSPLSGIIYFGGPDFGSWRQRNRETPKQLKCLAPLNDEEDIRLLMGYRDRKNHPWVKELSKVSFVKTGSIGLKVAKVLEEEADLFVHLSGKLKTWDTAGPAAIALGGRLEVGGMESDDLNFPHCGVLHDTSVIIGRPGSLKWCRLHLTNPSNL